MMNTAVKEAFEGNERENTLVRLRRVCGERGVEFENKVLFTVLYDDFSPNMCIGDLLVIDTNKKPELGEFAIASCGEKQQLVLVSGKSILGSDLAVIRYKGYPLTKELISTSYMGTVITHIKN